MSNDVCCRQLNRLPGMVYTRLGSWAEDLLAARDRRGVVAAARRRRLPAWTSSLKVRGMGMECIFVSRLCARCVHVMLLCAVIAVLSSVEDTHTNDRVCAGGSALFLHQCGASRHRTSCFGPLVYRKESELSWSQE